MGPVHKDTLIPHQLFPFMPTPILFRTLGDTPVSSPLCPVFSPGNPPPTQIPPGLTKETKPPMVRTLAPSPTQPGASGLLAIRPYEQQRLGVLALVMPAHVKEGIHRPGQALVEGEEELERVGIASIIERENTVAEA